MNGKTTRDWTSLRYVAVVPLIALGILSILACGGGSSSGGGGAAPGETVFLRVTEDIIVKGQVAIAKGARVKAKIRFVAKRAMASQAGSLNFLPISAQAIDGQWISLVEDSLGRRGAVPQQPVVYPMGVSGLLAHLTLKALEKGDAAFALRGTEYTVTIRGDTVIDPAKVKPRPALRKAALYTEAKFQDISGAIKFHKGKPGKDFVLEIHLTPELVPFIRRDPSSVHIVAILGDVLTKPIKPLKVERDEKRPNTLLATFEWWSLIRHAKQGETSMTVQLTLTDGRLAQAEPILQTEWKTR